MVERTLEMKHPPDGWWAGRRVLHCRHAQDNGADGSSTPLIRECDPQLLAADFKTGSHLVEGGLEKRRICPSGWLEGTALHDLPARAPNGESSVGPRNGPETLSLEHIEANGVSEYPFLNNGGGPYPEQVWEVPYEL